MVQNVFATDEVRMVLLSEKRLISTTSHFIGEKNSEQEDSWGEYFLRKMVQVGNKVSTFLLLSARRKQSK